MRFHIGHLLLVVTVGLCACKGDKGDPGPPGLDGKQGPAGPLPEVTTGGGLTGDGSLTAPLSLGAIDALRWNPVSATTTGVFASGPRLDLLRFLRSANTPILDVGSLAWENAGVNNPWVLKDGGQYRMYYMASGANWQIGVATASATGAAGADWFAAGQWQRHTGNPIIQIGGWASVHAIDPCVIKSDDPADPRPYKMWFTGVSTSYGIGFADSADGLAWTQGRSNPVIAQTLPAESSFIRWPSVIYDRTSATPYRMWYTCGDGSYNRVCYATSLDGLTWNKPQVNPIAASGYQSVVVSRIFENGAWQNAQAPTVLKVGRLYYMTLARGQGTPYQVHLLISRDGIAWTTVGQILHSEDADWWWDSSLQDRANVVLDGERAYIFYSGFRARFAIGAAVADLER